MTDTLQSNSPPSRGALTCDTTELAKHLTEQVCQSRGHLDTTRVDWCEVNLNHFGWMGNRAVICDHADTSDSAPTFRQVVDIAMARSDSTHGTPLRALMAATAALPCTATPIEEHARKKSHDALVHELKAADEILKAVLSIMTLEQKSQLAEKVDALGLLEFGTTRANERRAVLDSVAAEVCSTPK